MFNDEKIIETKTCKHCDNKFKITNDYLEFYDKISPIFNWKKYSIPSPKLCPDCRLQRRLSFRNERNLYKRKCDKTWNNIVSIYSPDKPYKVYEQNEYWSDNFNPLDYSKKFDFDKSFFTQFEELLNEVPRPNLYNTNSQNCYFCNYVDKSKNCYMSFFIYEGNENLLYSYWWRLNKDCIDISISNKMELSYNTLFCTACYKCMYLKDCYDCKECLFSNKLTSCSNCILCTNLVNKSYCINNKQYEKSEYLEIIKKLDLWSHKVIKQNLDLLKEIQSNSICKNLNINLSENCLWDNLTYCKNVKMTFKWHNLENVAFCNACWDSTNIYDIYSAWYVKNSYYWNAIWNSSNCLFCSSITWSKNLIYCEWCNNCENCFWCIWLRNKSYCILNKEYEKKEYEILVPKIIEHMKESWEWWEFFPSTISPFWYNETVAWEFFPLEKKQALVEYFNWSDYEEPFEKVDKIIPANKLPDNIKDIPNDILNRAVECEITKKPFKIIPKELEFYKIFNISLPHKHPDIRHLDRISLINPRKLRKRKCAKCEIEIITSYSPKRPETVYCESCYNNEIYWK